MKRRSSLVENVMKRIEEITGYHPDKGVQINTAQVEPVIYRLQETEASCETCKYGCYLTDYLYECRRYAPSARWGYQLPKEVRENPECDEDTAVTRFPVMYPAEWCGEYVFGKSTNSETEKTS